MFMCVCLCGRVYVCMCMCMCVCVCVCIYICIYVFSFFSFVFPILSSLPNANFSSQYLFSLKFSIFQKLVFKHKIVPFTRLPSFIVEEDISTLNINKIIVLHDYWIYFNNNYLFIIICNRFRFFMSLKPHHMFRMKSPWLTFQCFSC
jgi:hypothetical protein